MEVKYSGFGFGLVGGVSSSWVGMLWWWLCKWRN